MQSILRRKHVHVNPLISIIIKEQVKKDSHF